MNDLWIGVCSMKGWMDGWIDRIDHSETRNLISFPFHMSDSNQVKIN